MLGGMPASEEELLAPAEPERPRDPSALDGVAPEGGSDRASLDAAAAPELSDEQLDRAVAALAFASPEPLTTARLASLTETAPSRVEASIERVRASVAASGLPFELVAIAGGWQMLTAGDTAEIVARLARVRKEEKVSPAALETLAVVAYRQPVTKAEIEAIRGVQVGPILRALVDRGLVKVSARSDDPGRALLYATTKRFLESFGLAGLDDLPRDAELVRDA
jgi:segregation and condensation protein B